MVRRSLSEAAAAPGGKVAPAKVGSGRRRGKPQADDAREKAGVATGLTHWQRLGQVKKKN